MKATVTRAHGHRHAVRIRHHEIILDEPADVGGSDEGASPLELLAASLAGCVAVTIEMYAARKNWDVGALEIECNFTPPERGCPTQFKLVYRLPDTLTDEQVERLTAIASKCPVHRTLEGEVMFDERVERVALTS